MSVVGVISPFPEAAHHEQTSSLQTRWRIVLYILDDIAVR